MKKVINTAGFGTSEGVADQITLPNGKFAYSGVGSMNSTCARRSGWEVRVVWYFGACIAMNINDRAHLKFPIQIDEVSVADFIDKIATEKEVSKYFSEII